MQTGPNATLNDLFTWFLGLINGILVPLVFALAFILFLFGVFKFFFSSGAKAEDNRKEGKKFILWGVIAFVVMISLWGIVNLLVSTLNLKSKSMPCLPTFGNENCDPAPGPQQQGGVLPPA